MSAAGTVIVGGGQAGLQIAMSLRSLGYTAPITMLGAEAYNPYQRPPLSKGILKGSASIQSLTLRSEAYLNESGITLRRPFRVKSISLQANGPMGPKRGVAYSQAGETIEFDRLALATGARPRKLQVPGSDLQGINYLRSLDDALTLGRELASANHVVVVGGGFIGLEVAAVARAKGKVVTVLEAAPRLMVRAVAPVVSEFYLQAHTRRGTQVRLGAAVAAFSGKHGHVTAVELADGSAVPADLVVIGVGVEPRTELAQQLGLACDGGIVVDEYARTSVESVVAVGDCTALPNPMTGIGLVRLESVQNAVDQAKCAAGTLIGQSAPYRDVPWFWSDQDNLKLQIAGLSDGYEQAVIRGNPSTERFSVLYYRDDRVIAIDAVNQPRDYMAVRRALAVGHSVPASASSDARELADVVVPVVNTR